MKVLTVDDARTVRQMIREILEPQGHTVLEAENGYQALEVMKQDPDIDVVLLDWEMPKMDGYALLRQIRHQDAEHKTKVIMLTSVNKMTNILDAVEAGADEYIMKPFTEDIVLEKLRSV